MFLWLFRLVLAAFLLSGSSAHAQFPDVEIHVHAGLEVETTTPAAGSTVTLAITMRPDPGWHGYWTNPGDAGLDHVQQWRLPPGASVSAARFPVPDTLVISGLMNYVYKETHAILVDLKLPAAVAPGTKLPVSVDAEWLACSDILCVPQRGTLSTNLVIGDGSIKASDRARFDGWRAALPVPLDRVGRYAVQGSQVSIAIPFPANADISDAYFFPALSGLIDHMAPQTVRRSGDWLVVDTKLAKARKEPLPAEFDGLMRITRGQGLLVSLRPGDVPDGGVEISGGSPASGDVPSLPLLLLGAILGGLLLNIMPCVFPILGLKALALAKAGSDEGTARADALAYSAGVILSCVALGGIMLLLRAGGEEVGWAFQLQSPAFVLFLLLLMVAVTANLAGLFEFQGFAVGQRLDRMPGLSGSFWTGVLAAFVATPCTGPFMAAALGAALLLPSAQAIALFAALGLGIALPFLAIAFIAPLRTRLPKAGPWLATFRKAMAVPMALTAAALLWLLSRLTGEVGLWIGIAAILAMVLLLWLYRRNAMRVQRAGWAALAALLLVFAGTAPLLPDSAGTVASKAGVGEPFSEKRLAALRAQGSPVFVYFTADWCVTCKVNEAAVLDRAETAKLFADNGVAVLRGDFTRRQPEIAGFLAAQGAAGIPLYLHYPKGGEAKKLPQILTASILRDALSE